MIDLAMGLIASELNRHFRRTFQVPEDMVVLSNLFEQDGRAVAQATNKVVLFLAGLERDTMAHSANERALAGSRLLKPGPLFLNLSLVCTANFNGGNYKEALKYLSSAILFFHTKPVFDHQNAPDLDEGLERLILDLEHLDTNQLHSLWGNHGNRYQPSVLYRVRMITLDPEVITGREPVVKQLDVSVDA